MAEAQDPRNATGLNRRKFVGAVGAAAIAAGIPRKADAQSPPPAIDVPGLLYASGAVRL